MSSIRGALRFGTDLAIIVFLGVAFVLGLAVQTLLQIANERLPELRSVGGVVWNWIRHPI